MKTESCPGCGAVVPHIDGPVHPYIEAAPGCWALYGEVLAREYGEYGYPPIHRLTVDTYAAQHPGGASRLATQSVAVHLAGLQLVLDCGADFAQAAETISAVLRVSTVFPRFDRPEFLGRITVKDVHAARNLDEHINAVNRWAESTWQAWESQHALVHRWVDRQIFTGELTPR